MGASGMEKDEGFEILTEIMAGLPQDIRDKFVKTIEETTGIGGQDRPRVVIPKGAGSSGNGKLPVNDYYK